MTAIAPVGTLLSSADLAQASGLREDLVARFIPGTETPTGRIYPADRIAVAIMVKEMTDAGAPAPVIDGRVRAHLINQPQAAALPPPPQHTVTRRTLWTAVTSAAAAALLIGGVAGGLVDNKSADTAGAAPTVQAAAPTTQSDPSSPDPVCAEWGPLANASTAKQLKWGETDPTIPGSAWTPEQKALSLQVAAVMHDQAADLRRLADKATDPFWASLMREQALYEDAFASRLGPNYQSSDHVLWQAAVSYSSAVRATCLTARPK